MLPGTFELSGVPLEEALERWAAELEFQKALVLTPPEEMATQDSIGRITAAPVVAEIPSPHYYAAGIDGMATQSRLSFSASPENPVRLKMGEEAVFVAVGNPMPEGFDAVVSLESLKFISSVQVELSAPVAPWLNIKPVGEDVAAHEVLLPKSHKVTALDIGFMLQGGVEKIQVRSKPKVAVLALGDNLVVPASRLQLGQSIEFNSYILKNLIREIGGDAHLLEIAPERKEVLKPLISYLMKKYDLFLAIGGPSMGTRILAEVLSEIGEVIIYGIEVKPGQSVLLGIAEQKPFIGLPWYAVSCFIGFDLFAKPVLAQMLGTAVPARSRITCRLASDVASPLGLTEYLRTELGKVEDQFVALPISRGTGALRSMAKADGLLKIPPEITFLSAGTEVGIELLKPTVFAQRKLLIAGTHDIFLDFLRSEYESTYPGISLSSLNIGSLSGLLTLKAGLCHVSGVHIFDPETGVYNLPIIEELLPDLDIIVMNLFFRELGLIVKKGNPKNIKTFADLTRPEVTFINRRKGSGTRAFQDYCFKKEKIPVEQIKGYENEAFTHMSLALAVAGEGADVGTGIALAAKALNLDFIPLALERYDLVIPKKFFHNYRVKSLVNLVKSTEFKKKIAGLEGYNFSEMGKLIKE